MVSGFSNKMKAIYVYLSGFYLQKAGFHRY